LRLATFKKGDGLVSGVVRGDEIWDLTVVAPDLPRDLSALLATGGAGLTRIRSALGDSRAGVMPLSEVALGPPIARPAKFFAIGLNYADHVAESSFEPPEWPTVFTKLPTSVVGPGAAVERPSVSDQLDYEGELAFVIGRRCRHVPRDRAHEVIGGYMIVNDFSVRDWQRKTTQWTLGKGFDTHGATGPWIVTPDELDPHSLDLKTYVNGELRQSSNTRHLIHDCFSQVALISTVCTLEPGDIVATGTPGGIGSAMDPPRFLVPGDEVRVEIEGLGALENNVVAETSQATVIADEDALAGLAA
jgi:2-keto-4-pentenoate hydratase/2-oxohepta-3-ene-1,7-dioic acid hydratase in catechol pathway